MDVFKRDLTIAWGDCDDAGIVFYPNFFYWFDTTYHLYLRSLGLDMRDIKARFRAVTPLVDVHAKFRSPITYGDDVQIEAKVGEWASRRFRLDYVVKCGDRLVATGYEERAWAQFDDEGRLCGVPIPAEFKALFA
ncbi:acyl-CoA thioesterase [Pusillimonas sp. CC-YST705]|uniref:Acyl-CoA thioesterase n=1 Tax=Mesopusillimonas faecipullorum TaxID=2755040 RepID=A0ABS8CCU9_9BURK|nr:thioesterase family protein [Mesopusillimonas faecipullorum]MCB5363848.1 acyl-CoA thioesterase [Mesopusillimonas faecipullorum]